MNTLAVLLGLLLLSVANSSGPGDGKSGDKDGGKDGKDGPDHDEGPSRELHVNGAHIKASGKSGKLRLWREEPAASGATNETKPRMTPPIFIFLDGINEINTDGNVIEESKGNGKHQFRAFKELDFNLGDAKTGNIPNSLISSEYFEMNAQLKDRTSTLKMKVYVAAADGDMTIDGEVTAITIGNVKFSLELSDWEWCDATACDGDVGDMVEVSIAIGIPPERKVTSGSSGRPKKFEMGKNSFIDFSSKVLI